MGGWGTPYKLG
ncbi:hypothetical protein AYI70_g10741, partial [Smittium culicis]